MPTTPLSYERDGEHYFRCAWCQTERHIRTFRSAQLVLDRRTLALVCEDGNRSEAGELIHAPCLEEMRAAVPQLIALASSAQLQAKAAGLIAQDWLVSCSGPESSEHTDFQAALVDGEVIATERSPSVAAPPTAIEDEEPSVGDTVFIEEDVPTSPLPSADGLPAVDPFDP